jgi:enoyl-CoA hydratase/carnithine racemase
MHAELTSEVLMDIAHGVATITLNAPQRRNALTPDMADAMISAFDQVDADENVGAVVIQGAGGHFCAGAELGEAARMLADPLDPVIYDGTSRIYEAFVRVGQLRAPVIAAVRGAAVGAGMNLLLAADLRVVSRTARILSGFLRLGVHPGGGHMMLLAATTNPQAACALSVFSEEIDGDRAQAIGLAWAAVDDALVQDHAMALARKAAADPALARATIRTLRATAAEHHARWPQALQAERATQLWSMKRAGQRRADSTQPLRPPGASSRK